MKVSAHKLGAIAIYLLKSEDTSTKLEGYETLEMLCAAYLESGDDEAGKAFKRVWEVLPSPKKSYFVKNVTAFRSSFSVVPAHQDASMN
tara:strand:- start:1035 stop:1301 length:267 start_codon:yes stop_codon:yes gene_type:complete